MAVKLPIISEFDGKGIKKAVAQFKNLEGVGAKTGYLLKQAALPAAAAIGGVATALGVAAKAAADDQQSQQQLERQIRVSIGAGKDHLDVINAYVTKTQMSLGVTDDLIRAGLGNLLRATRDTTQATKLMNLALDISAATGKDAESVSIALAKGYGGQLSSLKKLGIPLDENIVKTKDFNGAVRQLSSTFGGAAQENANTFSGQVSRLKMRLGELIEQVGYKILPKLQTFLDKVLALTDAFNENGLSGALRLFREQMSLLKYSNDGGLNAFGKFLNTLVAVRNMIAHVINMFIRLQNLINPFKKQDFATIDMINIDQVNQGLKERNDLLDKANNYLKSYTGPVASRDFQELNAYTKEYAASLRDVGNQTDTTSEKTGGGTKKLKEHAKAVKEAAKAVNDDLAKAYENAVEALKDKFSPALQQANDKLKAAQDEYDGLYNGIKEAITGVVDLGAAWQTAADSEGSTSFLDALREQQKNALKLAKGVEYLINNGLDDPALLNSILSSGAETGAAIVDSLVAGGAASIKELRNLTQPVQEAADAVAKAAADKWFKAGVSQAQAMVDGINSIIGDTEFGLKFTYSIEGVNDLAARFAAAVGNVLAGGSYKPGSVVLDNNVDWRSIAYGLAGIPAMADGGIVQRPTLAMIGEAGPEAVVPLSQLNNANGNNVTINVHGGDPQAVVNALRTYMRRNGSVPVKVSNLY